MLSNEVCDRYLCPTYTQGEVTLYAYSGYITCADSSQDNGYQLLSKIFAARQRSKEQLLSEITGFANFKKWMHDRADLFNQGEFW